MKDNERLGALIQSLHDLGYNIELTTPNKVKITHIIVAAEVEIAPTLFGALKLAITDLIAQHLLRGSVHLAKKLRTGTEWIG